MLASLSGNIALESRKEKSKRLMNDNPGKIPIIMVKNPKSQISLLKEL